jgi:hypothetical protein
MRLSIMAVLVSVVSLTGLGTTFASVASASAGQGSTKVSALSGFYVKPADSGQLITIRDGQTGLCLDSNFSGDVYTDPCNGGNYQLWYEYTANNGFITFNDWATGLVLDSNYNGNVYTDPYNGGNYQNWWLSTNLLEGIQWIVDNQTGRVLDSNYSGDVYTNPQYLGDAYQDWSGSQPL